ncbi:CD276 antigen homolog [Halichoeres trimaculatus]|uniref:CD276 antigen homolog n=1 Tax=Halichoeres trimaculatus TaxID=147232 RepID=UPI003D9E2D22
MASTCILLCVLTFVSWGTATSNSFVTVQCKTETVGQVDQYSLLSCVVTTTKDVQDPEIQAVFWAKEGVEKPVLHFQEGVLTPSSSRYSLAEPSWNNKNMNVSLLIRKTSTKDEGVYTCMVYTDSGTNSGKISLKVTAKYTKPTFEPDPEKLDLNTGGSLTCKSSGYPEGRLRWFDKDNKEWIKNPPTEMEETENGLFSLSSTMTVVPGSSFFKYICRVFNARGEPEAEESYTVKDSPNAGGQTGNGGDASTFATKVVAPVVVIGSLIVGLLLMLVLMHRRRSRREHQAVPPGEFDEDESQEMEKLATV